MCAQLGLSGLTVIGGARSVTDFCYLAEGLRTRTLFAAHRQLLLTAVPVDISGALTCDLCEVSVGFDTASRLAAQVAGNNATDAASAKKYYYFQRLPGRSLVALEVALATHPNYVLLSEEVEARGWSLADITGSIADCICARAAVGKNYGTVLVPTGLLESSAELHGLCRELDAMQADGWQSGVPTATHTTQGTLGTGPQSEADARHPPLTTPVEAVARLTPWSRALFLSFPELAQRQLLADRNLHTIDLPQVTCVTRAPVPHNHPPPHQYTHLRSHPHPMCDPHPLPPGKHRSAARARWLDVQHPSWPRLRSARGGARQRAQQERQAPLRRRVRAREEGTARPHCLAR